MLLLHRETVEELCKRQVRSDGLKRKQEEVNLTATYKSGAFQFIILCVQAISGFPKQANKSSLVKVDSRSVSL